LAVVVPSAGRAQIRVEKTVVANLTVPDNGTIWSDIFWADSGLASIASASITLVLSSPFATNPLKPGDLSGVVYFGLPNEAYREFSLTEFTSATPTFNMGAAFNGSWLASNFWELELSDERGGGVARLDRWTLTLTGESLAGGTIDPGQGGVIGASGEGTQTIQSTIQVEGTAENAVKVQADAGQSIVVSSGLTGGGDIRKEGAGVLRLEGTSTNFTGKVQVDSGTVEIASSTALGSSGRLEIGGTNATVRLVNSAVVSNAITLAEGASVRLDGGGRIEGAIKGAGGLVKEGTNAVVLAGANTFTGSTVIREGRLILDSTASLASSSVTVTNAILTINGAVSGETVVSNGGVVGGSGTIGTLTMGGGGTLMPGSSAGTLTATNGASWTENDFYDWEIFDLAGPAGTGWDLLDVTGGTLNLAGITTAGGFTINLITLQGDNDTPGALSGFDSTANYSNWLIARAPEVVGFDPTLFTLNASGFVGATGTFDISLMEIEGGEGIFLTYSGAALGEPIPEPGTWAAAILLTLAAGYVRWRRRKATV
jgi:autotransporter-associated beta strand protein